MKAIEVALAHAANGHAVFAVPLPWKQNGKYHKTAFKGSHGHLDATTDPREIQKMFRGRLCTVAIALQDGSGVLDEDAPGALRAAGVMIPSKAVLVTTPRPGTHAYVRVPTGTRGSTNGGWDFKTSGGWVMAPGAVARDGATWAGPIPLPPVEEWPLLNGISFKALKKGADSSTFTENLKLEVIHDHRRNDVLKDHAFALAEWLHEPELLDALRSINENRCDPPLDGNEVATIARNAARNRGRWDFFIPKVTFRGQEVPTLERTQLPWPEAPDELIYHGLAGEVVNAIREHTEADPVALLLTVLTAFSAFAGDIRGHLSGATQPSNVFVVLVGPSGLGRKGTSFDAIQPMLKMQAKWQDLMVSGLQSGEALIRQMEERQDLMPMALVYESELGSVLINLERESSTLSQAMRHAFDGDRLTRIVARAHESNDVRLHHISLLAHVTPEELRGHLTIEQAQNGFANRVLWACVRKPHDVKPAPDPAPFVKPFAKPFAEAIYAVQRRDEIGSSRQAQDLFAELATAFEGTARVGLHAAVTARLPTLVIRLALIYAALDRAKTITTAHVKAAQALADYGARSALYIFGDLTGNRRADMIREFLLDGRPYSRTELIRELRMSGESVYDGLAVLRSMGLIQEWKGSPGPKGGRRPEMVASAEVDLLKEVD